MSILERHAEKWQPEPNTGCYIWTAATAGTRGKRPYVRYRGKYQCVTRIVCEEENGPPPFPKAEAAHKPLCGNALCVNGIHTYWASRSQNEMDKPPGLRKAISVIGVASVGRSEITGRFQ